MGGSQCDNDSSVITKLLVQWHVSYGMRQSFRLVNPTGVVQNSKGGTQKLIFSQTYLLVCSSLSRVLRFYASSLAVEKSQTNATNATMLPLLQAI